MSADYSNAAVTMGHLALKRAIRHAEANDLVNRDVAALVLPGRQAARAATRGRVAFAAGTWRDQDGTATPHTRPSPTGSGGASRVKASQAQDRLLAGERWQDTGLVFTTHLGTALDAGNVRKMFKRICIGAGIGDDWTPRELRTSFVSLISHHGVSAGF
jgi:hypothetical protein